MASPQFLYKILSKDQWKKSQNREFLFLSKEDDQFIHLSTLDQLDKIISKYWKDQEYVVLKLDREELVGKLVLESNPGGTTQYYHLYEGKIPLNAVIEEEKGA